MREFLILCMMGMCLNCGEPGRVEEQLPDASDVAADMGIPALVNCVDPGQASATASCLRPTQTPEYYIAQAQAYFDTLDITASRDSVPNYHLQVARWEWPPWLLLTGYGAQDMIRTSDALRIGDPSTVPERDCRFFETQPFARCYVEFEYEEGPCPIYEEFTFNDAGEMTFIEAWSVFPGMLPISAGDTWAEAQDFLRLSTRVPGLGNATGTVDLESAYVQAAAEDDPLIADYVMRASNWIGHWAAYLRSVGDGFFALGCGWSEDEMHE